MKMATITTTAFLWTQRGVRPTSAEARCGERPCCLDQLVVVVRRWTAEERRRSGCGTEKTCRRAKVGTNASAAPAEQPRRDRRARAPPSGVPYCCVTSLPSPWPPPAVSRVHYPE